MPVGISFDGQDKGTEHRHDIIRCHVVVDAWFRWPFWRRAGATDWRQANSGRYWNSSEERMKANTGHGPGESKACQRYEPWGLAIGDCERPHVHAGEERATSQPRENTS